jgi:hypothetical protein
VPDFARDFDEAFDRLDPPDKKGRRSNYVTLLALREALPRYDRKTFDAEINKLRRAQRYSLDASDGRHARMTRAEQAAGIEEAGELLVYAARAREPIDNPGPRRHPALNEFYSSGRWDVSHVFDPGEFDLEALAKKVENGEDLLSTARAAVDVYLAEAEAEEELKEGWLEQNEDEIAEALAEGPVEPDALYAEWRRGWRDGAVLLLSEELPLVDVEEDE